MFSEALEDECFGNLNINIQYLMKINESDVSLTRKEILDRLIKNQMFDDGRKFVSDCKLRKSEE